MQEIVVQGRMNVARCVTRKCEQIFLREEHAHRFVVPQTGNAEPIQPQRERAEENKKKPEAKGRFCAHGDYSGGLSRIII